MKNNNLKIEYISIDDIKPYENNAKIHTEEQIEQIKKSIKDFGMNDPIGIWKDNIIIEGHGRLLACKELGMNEIPVIRLDDLTNEQRKAYTLIHNQTTMNTGFDLDILNQELANIDIDMNDFGFDLTFDDDIFEDINDECLEEPKRFEHKMKIDKTEIIITDEEYENIMKLLDNYTENNGVTFGFVSFLVGDKFD